MSILKVLSYWSFFSKTSFGKALFSYLIGFYNPYTGALGAYVSVLEKGDVEILLKDKKKNRNHLNSVHAIALTNLGEFTSGLAVLSSLGPNTRGIVKHISIDFLKKARGTLMARAQCDVPCISEDTEFIVHTDIFNDQNECIARVKVLWQLGLFKSAEET